MLGRSAMMQDGDLQDLIVHAMQVAHSLMVVIIWRDVAKIGRILRGVPGALYAAQDRHRAGDLLAHADEAVHIFYVQGMVVQHARALSLHAHRAVFRDEIHQFGA